MRRVDEHQHVALLGDFELALEDFLLVARDPVEPDLADGHTPLMVEIRPHPVEHFAGQMEIFRFLGVHRHAGVVVDAVALGALGFEVEDELEVIEERSGMAPVRPEPE